MLGYYYPHIKLEEYATLQCDILSKSIQTIFVIMLIFVFVPGFSLFIYELCIASLFENLMSIQLILLVCFFVLHCNPQMQ